MIPTFIELAYLVGTGLFVLSLHWMSDPKTARWGVYAGIIAIGVAAFLFRWLLTVLESRLFPWQQPALRQAAPPVPTGHATKE